MNNQNQYFQQIDDFLSKNTEKQKIIVIYGPTACGKTSLSLDVAEYLKTSIIGADSKQIYRYMDIATGKILPHQMRGIPHSMIDIKNPDEQYSVGEYQTQVQGEIEQIHTTGNIPVLCGGTGLYIDSVIYDFDIPKIPANPQLRAELEDIAQQKGNQAVYDMLVDIDPEYAKTLHPNNLNYVIRGIEVKKQTGKSKTQFKTVKTLKYDILFITPYDGEREKLYEKINKRVQEMFDEGLVEETKKILEMFPKSVQLEQTIGYAQVLEYLSGEITLAECISQVQQYNRNYAKRQLTWCKNYEI